MKRLLLLVLITAFLLNSCNSAISDPEETSDIESTTGSISISPETTILPETEPETEPEVTWYYDDVKERRPELFIYSGEYPDEVKKTYITFPSIYEIKTSKFKFFIEPYADTVYLNGHLGLRVTVTNITDSKAYYGRHHAMAGYFIRDDGTRLESWMNDFCLGDDNDAAPYPIASGESIVFETLFQIEHTFFNAEHSYTFAIGGFFPAPPYEVPPTLEFPIRIGIAN